MKATSDDSLPRRDGWFEHRGTWEEVTVGTVLADPGGSRSKRWTVTEVSMGAPPHHIQYGYTLWMRIREATTGEMHTIAPRPKPNLVTILTQDPADRRTADPTAPSDADAIALLISELGAEHLATRDDTTGEITCPDYVVHSHIPGHGEKQISRGLIEHLRFAHAMSVDDEINLVTLFETHGHAHNPAWPNIGKGGFVHRHVPEDLSTF